MKFITLYRAALCVSGFIALFSITAISQTYTGQATAVKVMVDPPLLSPVTTAVADTGPLPAAGGNVSLTSVGTTVAGVLTVGSSNVNSSGVSGATHSDASVNNLNVSALGNTITADVVSATADCNCPFSIASDSSTIVNLVINGSPITIDGTANQTILLPGGVGTVVIDEEIAEPRVTTVNAIHIHVTALDTTVTDIIVASARAGIDCATAPTSNLYGGFGKSVDISQTIGFPSLSLSTQVADTGWLPRTGGSINVATANAGSGTLLTTGAATASTSGGLPGGDVNTTQSASEIDGLGMNLVTSAVVIGADVLKSNTQCVDNSGVVTCTGSSTITNLSVKVFGVDFPISISGTPNQVVVIPVLGLGSVTLTINQQISSASTDITVNALKVDISLTGLASTSVTLAASHSDMQAVLGTTAAPVSIAGRVVDTKGRGLSGVRVTAVGDNGQVRTVLTNPFGFFAISGLEAGRTYVVSAVDKQYKFASRLVNAGDDILGLNFAPVSTPIVKQSAPATGGVVKKTDVPLSKLTPTQILAPAKRPVDR